MSLTPIQDIESERITALHQLQILDTPPEEDIDDIAVLAAQICDTPIAAVAFEDSERVWFKAKLGMDVAELPRENGFCPKEPGADGLTVVYNIAEDETFAESPLADHGVRFFAGSPLINDDGFLLGYLCVMDYEPRHLSIKQLTGLHMLGRQLMSLLKMRQQVLNMRRDEEELRDAEEQMNTIFHNSIVGVVVIDDHEKILQWNPKAEAIFGWTAQAVQGRNFSDTIIPSRYRRDVRDKMTTFAKRGDEQLTNQSMELKALRSDGTEFDIALGMSPATINGKHFFINFVSDITDRILATRKLDDQKEFYENILNKLPADIAVFDANHKYLFVSPGGIKDPELRKYIIGKDDFEYAEYRNRDKSVAQIRRDQFMEVKKSGKEIRWEDTVKAPNGMPFTHLRRLFPVHDENGQLTLVIGFGVDITDRKIMEEKQTALVSQLSAQNTQLVDFCNIVSHNLRAPLVNMSMLVNFIEESIDEEEKTMLISKLRPVIDNLHTTFNELVESIQIKQDLEVESEKIDLNDCLQRTIDGLKMEINKYEALIDFNFEAAPAIYFPSKYLFSIFHNLISNALKYQSPKRKPIIHVETKRNNGSIILLVKDNGQGIDLAKHKDNMFKIGKVFHNHPNAKGFGLFMTKTQIEAMGGVIWVESRPDEGATFFIEFKNQMN